MYRIDNSHIKSVDNLADDLADDLLDNLTDDTVINMTLKNDNVVLNTLNNTILTVSDMLQSMRTFIYSDAEDDKTDQIDKNLVTLERTDNSDHIEICKNYIPRKDRPRRGKREKKGRVMKMGTYFQYDQETLEYFRAYKNIIRGFRSSLDTTVSIGYTGATKVYEGATILVDALLRKSYPPFNSNLIDDMSHASMSFSGGGYNCAYHLGIVKYIFEHPDMFKNVTFLGASGGAGVAAVALAYQNDPNRMNILQDILDRLIEMGDKGYTLSEQVDRYTNILLTFIDKERFNANIRASYRLQLSVTDITNVIPYNTIVTKFKDLKHLEETIRASACIPILLDDQIRKIGDRHYLDGGLTNNLPALDTHTIRISCLNYPTLQAEIHPRRYLSLTNCFIHPGEQSILLMMEEGYIDCIQYMNSYLEKEGDKLIEKEIHEIETAFVNS